MQAFSKFPRTLAAPLLLALLASSPAAAATSVKSRHDNLSLVTAQDVAFQPDLVLKQKARNDTLASAQPVSPTHYGFDVFGNLTQHQTSAFFGLALAAGDFLHMEVEAKDPTTQFVELLLYDPNGNLVAIANGNASNGSGSVIDFTIPGGDGGTWTAQVTGSPSHPEPKASRFRYDLRITTASASYRTDVLGRFAKNDKPGFYVVSANVGDHLHFAVEAKDPTKGFPELLLYDPNGNLVAIANGNASNGSGSIIDFTVPGGDGGGWTVEVTGSPSVDPRTNHFPYDLEIEGATGVGPVVPR
jgi:hypothetical protein